MPESSPPDTATLITDHDSWCRRVTDNEDQLRQSFASAKGLKGALSATGGATQDATDAMNEPSAAGSGSTPAEVKASGWVGKGPIGLGTDPSSEDFGATRFEAEDVDRSSLPNFGDAHGSYLDDDTESLYNIGKIVDGHGDDVEEAEQSYDPWYSGAVDPEWDRDPTANEPGRSDTGPDAT